MPQRENRGVDFESRSLDPSNVRTTARLLAVAAFMWLISSSAWSGEIFCYTTGSGTIIRSPDKTNYQTGDTVRLTAIPGRYYRFDGWSDGEVAASRTIVIGSQNRYEAVFTKTIATERVISRRIERNVYGTDLHGVDFATFQIAGETREGGFFLGGYTFDSYTNDLKSTPAVGGLDVWFARFGQDGGKLYDVVFGGVFDDTLSAACEGTNGIFLLVGNTQATNGMKTWTAKIDPKGQKLSQTLISQATTSVAFAEKLPQGGFLIAASSAATTDWDYWLKWVDENGQSVRTLALGGTRDDILPYFVSPGSTVKQMPDGGWIVGGQSRSGAGGAKTSPNFGETDFWVIRLDAAYHRLWDQAFGGSGTETLTKVIVTSDGGYLLAGTSNSGANGNKSSPSWNSQDMWVVRLDANGNKLWDKAIGGFADDILAGGLELPDSGFVLLGTSYSDTGGNKSAPSYGGGDYWVVRIDRTGRLLWNRSFGGTGLELAYDIRRMPDGGFMLLGLSNSNAGGNRTSPSPNPGEYDPWVIRLDSDGNTLWETAFPQTALVPTSNFGFGQFETISDSYASFSFHGSRRGLYARIFETEIPLGSPRIYADSVLTNYVSIVGSVTVDMITSFPNGAVFYTLDGTSPGLTSKRYSGRLTLTKSGIIRAVAYTADFSQSIEAEPVTIVVTPSYKVTVTTAGGGTVGLDATSGTYASNSVARLTATASPGWSFLSWTGSTNSSLANLDVLVDGPKSLQASFGTTLTKSTAGSGSISFLPDLPLFPFGSIVTVTAKPDAGYFLASWGDAASGTGNPLQFRVTIPTQSVSAAFLPKLNQTIQFDPIADRVLGDPAFSLQAASSSGLPIVFSVLSGPALVSGALLSVTNAGTVTVRAAQSGNEFYNAALPVDQAFRVSSPGASNGFTATVVTIAGSGVPGNADTISALDGTLNDPDGPSLAQDGTIYFADVGNSSIRYISPNGSLGTLAGGGIVGYLNAIGTNALFSFPLGVRTTDSGDVLVVDTENDVIRRIVPTTREVTTFAGNGARGFVNGPSALARFSFPNDLVIGGDGALYVTEFLNHTVRRVGSDGSVTTFAGTGAPGYLDGPANTALFNQPAGIAAGLSGEFYVTEWSNHRVRRIAANGSVTTVAGTGAAGFRDGPANLAQFNNPNGVVVMKSGDLFLTDTGNHAIRRITADGTVTTVAGNGTAGFADGSPALFNAPSGITVGADGSLIVTDSRNNRVRKISFVSNPPKLEVTLLPGIGAAWAFQLRAEGNAASRFRIETSPDLRLWSLLKEASPDSDGLVQLVGLAQERQSFYRVLSVP